MRGRLVLQACGMAACLALLASSAEPGRLELRFRDSRTGERIEARVRETASGRQLLRVEAHGYRPLEAAFAPAPGATLPVTVWLDPIGKAEAPAPDLVAGVARFEGRVFDAGTGLALGGARVRLTGVEATTNADGTFVLERPAPPVTDMALPATDDLVVSADGYVTQVRRAGFLVAGRTRWILDLEPGTGAAEAGERHKLLRSPEELRSVPDPPAWREETASPAAVEPAVPVPAAIRVGTSCTCATCSEVQVFSLDTYTRLGLDDEWIASWRADSLRAGAIAYRSYGAYHVAHPRSASYDICSTTCCQVLDAADSHANSDAATAFTSGLMVVNAAQTEPFFAEYSAENNGNGTFCPDGQSGRPPHDWPCLADAVDAGTTFNGHGRGMCQWGTQRWAASQGRDYVWIVNHYYNDNGNPAGARSGLLQVPGFTLSAPSTVKMGRLSEASVPITVAPQGGFAGTVSFAVGGLPFGVEARFEPPTVSGGGATALILRTGPRVPGGSHALSVIGTSGVLAHTAALTLVIAR